MNYSYHKDVSVRSYELGNCCSPHVETCQIIYFQLLYLFLLRHVNSFKSKRNQRYPSNSGVWNQ